MSETQETVDISSELNTIATDPYGANVKQAIYDALVKVNNAKIPLPPSGKGFEPEIIVELTTFADETPPMGDGEAIDPPIPPT